MITYKWSIEKVKVTGDTNLVTHVYWRCDANDEDLSAASAGISELTLGDTFTAYDKLTEQQVLDWCFEPKTIEQIDNENNLITIVNQLKTDTEAQLADQIAYQLAQKQLEPALPWIEIPA
jgi:hypothetical protein